MGVTVWCVRRPRCPVQTVPQGLWACAEPRVYGVPCWGTCPPGPEQGRQQRAHPGSRHLVSRFTDEQRASESGADGPSFAPSRPMALPAPLMCLVCFQGPWRAEVAVPLLGPQPEAAHWTGRSRTSWQTPSPAPRGSQVARWSRGARTWAAPARPFGKTWTASSPTSLPARRRGAGRGSWGGMRTLPQHCILACGLHLRPDFSEAGWAVRRGA